ncbi:2342_t:CDS:2 [Ambispora leptoticha]|uniref:2342_t:CDS:1 n=1 Tax=Ambispora leptoticha TaxID=144679 RepID=A0A9N9DM64_9GLOM|nr:2342_t:CDS:2 [Ambispora leptoticha]
MKDKRISSFLLADDFASAAIVSCFALAGNFTILGDGEGQGSFSITFTFRVLESNYATNLFSKIGLLAFSSGQFQLKITSVSLSHIQDNSMEVVDNNKTEVTIVMTNRYNTLIVVTELHLRRPYMGSLSYDIANKLWTPLKTVYNDHSCFPTKNFVLAYAILISVALTTANPIKRGSGNGNGNGNGNEGSLNGNGNGNLNAGNANGNLNGNGNKGSLNGNGNGNLNAGSANGNLNGNGNKGSLNGNGNGNGNEGIANANLNGNGNKGSLNENGNGDGNEGEVLIVE